MAELIITLPDGRKVRHTLRNKPEVIGRDAACDIPLDDPSASRRHARFSPTPHGYTVEDLGSKNGTLVNEVPCTSKTLADGDQVQIGAAVAVFSSESPSSVGSVIIAEDDITASHATRYVSSEKRLLIPQQRLQMIYELSGRLTTLQSQDSLFDNAMDICFETLHFERGAIGIRRRDQRSVDWPVVRNLRGAEGEITLSRTLLNRALEHGERAIFTDDGSATADPTVSMVQQGIRSAMCVPLIHQDETLGVIYGDRISTSTYYSDEDIDFLAGIAQQVSIGLINNRLMDDQRQMVRLNHELDLARSIQTGLLPASLPQRKDFRAAAINDPGDRISGDYYDVIERPDGRVWCLIADVTGEGVPAALLMANLQAAVRATIDEADDPGSLLERWNLLICHNTAPSKFITCLLALIDPKEHSIRFASAGHFPPLILRASTESPEDLGGECGFPLGVVEEADYVTTSAELGSEPFTFFGFTDGVVEAMDASEHIFGAERLTEILREHRALDPQPLVKQVRRTVAKFVGGAPQSDDITIFAARVGSA